MATKKNNEVMQAAGERIAIPKENFIYILAGLGVMVLGYILMAGGGSDDMNLFNPAIFSFRRIVLAPILIVGGIVVEIVAIMKVCKFKKQK